MNPAEKEYVVVVQCHLVKQRCSGYLCEKALHERTGWFADYPADRTYRSIHITCGGCCGRATQRKLLNLIKSLEKDGVTRDRLAVHLSTCIAKGSFHGPPCPHLEYLRDLIGRLKVDVIEGSMVSKKAQAGRSAGVYEDPSSS